MRRRKKEYWEMTTDELAAATREFEQEGISETFRAMTPAEERAWRAAVKKRRPERAANSKSVRVISVGIETGLLERADKLARKRGISRAKLVTEGLRTILAKDSR